MNTGRKNTSGDALYWRPPSVLPLFVALPWLRLPALPIDEQHRRCNAANEGIDFLRLVVKRKRRLKTKFLPCFAQPRSPFIRLQVALALCCSPSIRASRTRPTHLNHTYTSSRSYVSGDAAMREVVVVSAVRT